MFLIACTQIRGIEQKPKISWFEGRYYVERTRIKSVEIMFESLAELNLSDAKHVRIIYECNAHL